MIQNLGDDPVASWKAVVNLDPPGRIVNFESERLGLVPPRGRCVAPIDGMPAGATSSAIRSSLEFIDGKNVHWLRDTDGLTEVVSLPAGSPP